MSEKSEKMGRCYNEMKVSRDMPTDHLVIADAIDRLAADVAAIKAKVDAISDVAHLLESDNAWVKLVEEQRDAAIRERDEARAEVERLKAARDAPQPEAPPAGWLTEREQHALRHILASDVEPAIRSILARAGSPPVVEVPALSDLSVAARVEAQCYRAALDKAGVKWKEVPRE